MSETTNRGRRSSPSSTRRRNRSAACRSRRTWTNMSTTGFSWSTARQSRCFLPLSFRCTTSGCHFPAARPPGASTGPDVRHHRRLASSLTVEPYAPLRQQILSLAVAQGKAVGEPHGRAANVGREPGAPVERVAGG